MISGSAAKIELRPSESLTGSKTCWYMPAPLRRSSSSTRQTTLRHKVRTALFVTCFNDTLFPGTGKAVVELLERLGVEVEFPEAQTCCGQMHTNSGYADDGDALVERFKRVFAGFEAVVSPSASCVAHLRGHGVEGVFELTEFLVDVLGVEDVGAVYPHRVAYHPTCHSLRLLKIGDRPLRLLRAVQGIDLVELEDARECCGFGGVFAVKNADTSMAMLSDKLRHVLDTGAEVCTSADNSCLMHIGGALKRQRTGVRTVHLAEILAATRMRASPPPRARHAARLPAAPQRRQGDLDDPRQAREGGRGGARLGGVARGRQRRSRRARWRRSPSSSSAWRPPSPARGASCTGRATPRRRTASWPASPTTTARAS